MVLLLCKQDPNTYQGYTTKKVRKVEVSYEDIVKGKTIIDLGDDFNKYIKGINDGIIKADKISEDEYMNAVLGSKFAHDMEADDFISGLSFVLDCIPVVGGIKNIAEACSGTTMTGEKLSDDERVMLGVGGLLSIGIDIATFGSLSGATTAAKVGSFTIKVGIETGQAMVIGLGSQYLIENGCNPLLAFAIMAGATVAGGAAFSKVTAKPSIKLDLDTLASKGINNVDELAKHGITSMDDLAKLGVKNSDDLAKLGIKNADDLAKFGVNSLEDLKHIGLGDLATYKSIDDIFDSKKSFMDMMDATEAARYEKYLSSKLTDGLPPNMDMDDYLRYQKALNKLDEISAYNKVNGNAILDIRREADNLLKYGVKNTSDLGKLGITSIDDLTKLGIKNTDDLLSLGVKNIDDLKQVGIKGLDEFNSIDKIFKGLGNEERLIPGMDGVVTGGNSTKLGKNMLGDMGVNGSKWSGYQAQHIIPAEAMNHPVIQKIGMDFDDASNGLFLRTTDDGISTMSRHKGYHSTYNDFVLSELDKIDIAQSSVAIQKQVLDLQSKLITLQKSGLPLYPKQGASIDLWERWFYK
ncbi:putative toxin of predicted polymorphic toxin system [Breznakia blatticola]|uniref:Putative toxin of predicted polymorphic toxin system n=1 Tax=Breznakia blatticola TaxID=1754012 RepID=A0A4R7ZIN7_9FIRM|nr:AHH domain-containing protein [Breznakia blatticola]TDW16238.1 putative toxin of predicted polymorphic toxin system [Breznakia blatticola]